MSTYVVGDIHGGLLGLKDVLEKVPYNEHDSFIFLGDYVDGWSEAAQTINFLMEFKRQYSCVFLRGNHDYLLEQYLSKGDKNPMWLNAGGSSTLKSYTGLLASQKKQHCKFLAQLDNYYIDGQNRLFIHAGFTNQHGPSHEYYPNLVYWDRTLWEMACAMDPLLKEDALAYPKRLLLFDEIYIGHTPTTKLGCTTPLQRANVWNIDTGAAFKGPLTILDIDSKAYWQSDRLWKLYPGESGRNN